MKKLIAISVLALSVSAAHGLTGSELAEDCKHVEDVGSTADTSYSLGVCYGFITGFVSGSEGNYINLSKDGQPLKLYQITYGSEKVSSLAKQVAPYLAKHPADAKDDASGLLTAITLDTNEMALTLAVDESK